MKYIGFIKEYENLREANNFDELITTDFEENFNQEKLLHYLNSGVLLLCWMGYFTDLKTKELIAPKIYFTDGIWIWPSYFPYYLKKFPKMKIDINFINFLQEKNFEFKIDKNFDNVKLEIENKFSEKLKEEGLSL